VDQKKKKKAEFLGGTWPDWITPAAQLAKPTAQSLIGIASIDQRGNQSRRLLGSGALKRGATRRGAIRTLDYQPDILAKINIVSVACAEKDLKCY